MTARDDIEAVAGGVLREHVYVPSLLRGVSRCGCGKQMHGMPHDHRTHVAAVLTEALAPMVAEVRAEALREAADDVLRGAPVGNESYSGRQVADYLEARARRIARAEAVTEQGGGSDG